MWTGQANICGFRPSRVGIKKLLGMYVGFPGGSVVKNPPASAGDMGLIPELGKSLGYGNCNPLQYCLGNPMSREAWLAIVHGVAKESGTT